MRTGGLNMRGEMPPRTHFICTIPGCGKTHEARGYCATHYKRWQMHGDPMANPFVPKGDKLCSIDGCNEVMQAKGYCKEHYRRWYNHGDPLEGRPPIDESFNWLRDHLTHHGKDCLTWPYSSNGQGYAIIGIDNFTYPVTRLICTFLYGLAPTNQHQAAHSCGKGHEGCVNPDHLRWATPLENNMDKFEHGTILRGDDHVVTVVTEKEVLKIIERLNRGDIQQNIADDYGISQGTVSAIHTGKTWAWLTGRAA